MQHAALAAVVGLVGEHRRGREPQHVERADQVDADDGLERLERVRAAAPGGLLGPADAGAADADAQRRPAACDRRLDLAASVTSVWTNCRAELRGRAPSPRSSLRSAIVTLAPAAFSARAVAAPRPGRAAGDERVDSLDLHARHRTRYQCGHGSAHASPVPRRPRRQPAAPAALLQARARVQGRPDRRRRAARRSRTTRSAT